MFSYLLFFLFTAWPSLVSAHDTWLPLGPLGVPGFPDCTLPSHLLGQDAPTTVEEVAKRAMLLECRAKPAKQAQISIACIGDSITAGVCASSDSTTYPAQLQGLLDKSYPGQYVVTNFGACGSTMQQDADSPYWERPQWPAVLASEADIVVIMLGTNDAKTTATGGPPNWENDGKTGLEGYVSSYYAMVEQLYANLGNDTIIYTAIPPPLYGQGVIGADQAVINYQFPSLIPLFNAADNLPEASIDVFDAMGGTDLLYPQYFCDGCHPVDEGYTVLAQAVMDGLGL